MNLKILTSLSDAVNELRDRYRPFTPDLPPMDDPSCLTNRAVALKKRYGRSGKMEILEEAMSLNLDALALRPPGHPDRAISLNNLAMDFGTLYQQLDKIEDLEQAISFNREALALCPPGHPSHSRTLTNLAMALGTRYKKLHNMKNIEEAILLNHDALALHPPGHPDRAMFLNNLAVDISTRYRQLGKIEDLEQAILLNRDALALRPPGHPSRSSSLYNLAADLMIRYNTSFKIEDLEEAISLGRDSLRLRPTGHPDRPMSLHNLAVDLRTRYTKLGKLEDLEEAASLARDSLALHPPGHPDRAMSLNNLAVDMSTHYTRLGEIEDLEEAISLNRDALALRPPGHPLRSASLNNLAVDICTRYEKLGKIEDLEQSISFSREALALCTPGHLDPGLSTTFSNLASALSTRYQRLGNIEDLEQAISFQRDALTLRPPGHASRFHYLNNLAADLRTRYNQSGKMEDLEEAILLNRDALALRPRSHPDCSMSLNNLSVHLSTRYGQLGKMEDLEEAILLNHDALALRPPGHPHRSMSLTNLSIALSTRYKQLGKTDDLEEAISLGRDALVLRPPGHLDRSISLHNLASNLSTRYRQVGIINDLEDAILLNREALAQYPPGHPNRATSLNNLAVDISTRYKRLGEIEDLEEAISFEREALISCTAGHPEFSLSLQTLANDLLTRYKRLKKHEDIQEVFTLLEQASSDPTSYVKARLYAATRWAQIARHYRHKSTLNAYTISLELLQQSLTSRLNVEEQYMFLASAGTPRSLASDAASAAIQAGNLEMAVEFLEQGRAMLWSRIDGYKSPLEQLRQVKPDGGGLADELETLSADLAHLVLISERAATLDNISTAKVSFDTQTKQHRILSERWEEIVGKIRQMPGFTHFLQTPPFATLQSAAIDGPVIFLNVSKFRSDAIIIAIDQPPILVPLPDVDLVELDNQAGQLKTKPDEVVRVLRFLWHRIVSPVASRLLDLGVEKKSRIWWCPTGALCSLPLHAAGPYRPGERNLPDIYTSSYTSTLTSLIRARSNIAQLPPKLLVVGQTHETLEKVGEEVENIIDQYGDLVDVLTGPKVNHEAVLGGLKQHSWVHFACHGHLGDNAQPFRASFELHDRRRLTLLELIQARLPNAESAFLAACHSAEGDSSTPDENLHLSAALQFCGFRSVVGTLWEMIDDDGPRMSREFYRYMFRDRGNIDFRDSAYALSAAVREMRKAKLGPEHWAMFVHIGA